jgi:mannose-6-phosphate isomerase-like protein (cupin superfamily)
LLILQGRAEVILEDERIVLEEGDAVYFDASLRHRLLACEGTAVQVLAVVTR